MTLCIRKFKGEVLNQFIVAERHYFHFVPWTTLLDLVGYFKLLDELHLGTTDVVAGSLLSISIVFVFLLDFGVYGASCTIIEISCYG